MTVKLQHPSYDGANEKWIKVNDAYEGQEAIKRKGQDYLPAPSSYLQDSAKNGQVLSAKGTVQYERYINRAEYPAHFKGTIKRFLGVLNKRKPEFLNIPDQVQPLVDDMTGKGEPAYLFIRRVQELQLWKGHGGAFLDLPSGETTGARPFVTLFQPEQIINWSPEPESENDPDFVVLKYPRHRLNGFQHVVQDSYIVLEERDREYHFGEFDQEYSRDETFTPLLNNRPLEGELPFVFFNAMNTDRNIEPPPLTNIADLAIKQYQNSADYEHCYHQQGQGTLFVRGKLMQQGSGKNAKAGKVRTGAGNWIHGDHESDAKFLNANAQNIAEMRNAIERLENKAQVEGAQLLSQTPSSVGESGSALKIRYDAETITLNNVAITSATVLEAILKIYARWLRLPEEVVEAIEVKPFTDFLPVADLGQDFNFLIDSKIKGMPLTRRQLVQVAIDKGFYDRDAKVDDILTELDSEPLPGGLDVIPQDIPEPPEPPEA